MQTDEVIDQISIIAPSQSENLSWVLGKSADGDKKKPSEKPSLVVRARANYDLYDGTVRSH